MRYGCTLGRSRDIRAGGTSGTLRPALSVSMSAVTFASSAGAMGCDESWAFSTSLAGRPAPAKETTPQDPASGAAQHRQQSSLGMPCQDDAGNVGLTEEESLPPPDILHLRVEGDVRLGRQSGGTGGHTPLVEA